jgi:protein-S-isoprenylcysteine O-methyltransferase Ste14
MTESTPPAPRSTAFVSWAIKGLLAKVVVALILLISAGRWDWTAAWVFVGIYLAFDVATALVVLPRSPDLLLDRTRMQPGTAPWDKAIMPLAASLLPMACWIVAGLNERFRWMPTIPNGVQILAAAVTAGGFALTVWAMAANAFFSATVRLQPERGQRVASGGPYRWVRHPGYVGAIMFTLAMPILLDSLWALIPAALAAVLYVVRTALEDNYLAEGLAGYREYQQRVPNRLLPRVW